MTDSTQSLGETERSRPRAAEFSVRTQSESEAVSVFDEILNLTERTEVANQRVRESGEARETEPKESSEEEDKERDRSRIEAEAEAKATASEFETKVSGEPEVVTSESKGDTPPEVSDPGSQTGQEAGTAPLEAPVQNPLNQAQVTSPSVNTESDFASETKTESRESTDLGARLAAGRAQTLSTAQDPTAGITPAAGAETSSAATAAAASSADASGLAWNQAQGAAQQSGGQTTSVVGATPVSGPLGATSAARTNGPSAPSAPREAPNLDRVLQQVKLHVKPGRSQITFRVDPPDLGRLDIKLIMKRGHLVGEITADKEEVARLLESGLDRLRQTIEQAGVNVDVLDVKHKHEEQVAGGPGQQQQRAELKGETETEASEANSEPTAETIELGLDGAQVNVIA